METLSPGERVAVRQLFPQLTWLRFRDTLELPVIWDCRDRHFWADTRASCHSWQASTTRTAWQVAMSWQATGCWSIQPGLFRRAVSVSSPAR